MQRAFCLLVLSLALPVYAADGVREIDQECAQAGCFPGDEPGFPVTIAEAGSYQLTSNLESQSNGSVVEIPASRVMLDLNGFSVIGSSVDDASVVVGDGSEVSLSKGSVSYASAVPPSPSIKLIGFGSEVVRVSALSIVLADYCRVIDSRGFGIGFDNNGIAVGSDCVVSGNHVSSGDSRAAIRAGDRARIEGNWVASGSTAVWAGAGSLVKENTVLVGLPSASGVFAAASIVKGNVIRARLGLGHTGIICSGCVVEGNVVEGFSTFGLRDPTGTTAYRANRFSNNNGGNEQVEGGVEIGDNVCGDRLCTPSPLLQPLLRHRRERQR